MHNPIIDVLVYTRILTYNACIRSRFGACYRNETFTSTYMWKCKTGYNHQNESIGFRNLRFLRIFFLSFFILLLLLSLTTDKGTHDLSFESNLHILDNLLNLNEFHSRCTCDRRIVNKKANLFNILP